MSQQQVHQLQAQIDALQAQLAQVQPQMVQPVVMAEVVGQPAEVVGQPQMGRSHELVGQPVRVQHEITAGASALTKPDRGEWCCYAIGWVFCVVFFPVGWQGA
mmetsp:Transcript_6167/g.7228  ORF Transcript_6167/g.7228 Transcript_6167/m.7228 type:complete len:103 (+) Transcript_6167:66-374(+)